MKVYITKWWATRGIIEDEGGEVNAGGYYSHHPDIYIKFGSGAFATRLEAEQDVRRKALAKLATLRKQIAKIERDWLGGGTVRREDAEDAGAEVGEVGR